MTLHETGINIFAKMYFFSARGAKQGVTWIYGRLKSNRQNISIVCVVTWPLCKPRPAMQIILKCSYSTRVRKGDENRTKRKGRINEQRVTLNCNWLLCDFVDESIVESFCKTLAVQLENVRHVLEEPLVVWQKNGVRLFMRVFTAFERMLREILEKIHFL